MGAIPSLDFVPSNYKIKYIDSMTPSKHMLHMKEKPKAKFLRVMISKGHIETVACRSVDLTVGWLLSEITRRYQDLWEKHPSDTRLNQIVVGFKTIESIHALDYYLTHLDNSLAPIKESTLLAVHYWKVDESLVGIEDKPQRIWKEDFHFLKVIGCGGYSNVVLARKKDSGRLYAIKVIKKDSTYLKTNKDIYLAEAAILQKLTGLPFIVDLHYTFQTETELYFAMDPCIGGTLFFLLSHCAKGHLNMNVVKFYMAEIIVALEKVHAK